jgi:hypothetical protein
MSGNVAKKARQGGVPNRGNFIPKNHRVYGFRSSVRNNGNNYKTQSFGNWDCFRVQVRGGGPPAQLGPYS